MAGVEDTSVGLLGAVADTLMPGVRIEDDGALRAALAPVARAVEARRPRSLWRGCCGWRPGRTMRIPARGSATGPCSRGRAGLPGRTQRRRVLLVERGESLRRADLPRDHLRNARVFTGLERQVDPPLRSVPYGAARPASSAAPAPAVRLLAAAREPNDLRAADFLGQRAEAWLRAGGARTASSLMWALSKGPSAGQHQAGTCRMGADRRTSVTDRWGRVWGHDGVTIADGSLHVTNGGVNPVLTILALARRTSERLAGELGP